MALREAIIDCLRCGAQFAGFWFVEEQEEPEPAQQTCPECGHAEEREYPGWTFFTEAG